MREFFLLILGYLKEKKKKVLLILNWEDTRSFALRTREGSKSRSSG